MWKLHPPPPPEKVPPIWNFGWRLNLPSRKGVGWGWGGAGAHYVTDLHVLEYHDCEDISGNISHPILKANVKYRNLET